ncbi:MAG: hypothetical protein JWQ98_1714 [Chlorobi bacterium]|nr:hypothetical protein [Chlorobiota bacterium]
MKKFLPASVALILFLLATPGFAQLTGPSLLGKIRDNLNKQTSYKVSLANDAIIMTDARSGVTVCTVRQESSQKITLSCVVARLKGLSAEKRQQLQRKIALFNFSSAVGTLWYDSRTGEVTMEHFLNPRQVSPVSMASVAARFGETYRAEVASLTD